MDNRVALRVLEEYGAMFVASEEVLVPPVCMFKSSEEVLRFQEEATFRAESFGDIRIELQPAAMDALVEARAAAKREGLTITPRGGSLAARRSFEDTLRLWNSRVLPALDYWSTQRARMTEEEAERLRHLAPEEQVAEVLELEKEAIFFSKDLSKTILQSVAAPGASQHLAMLAFDAVEFGDASVRRLLARHGWFQTIVSDLPHFTFLGFEEDELPARGLRRTLAPNGQVFWTPDMRDE